MYAAHCAGRQVVEQKLLRIFDEQNFEEDDYIEYNQWTTTDRSNIVRHSSTVPELVEAIAAKVDELSAHHFIKEKQSAFLKELKSQFQPSEVIIQMDFAENYAFLVQDASQAFHWNNSQATLHPIVVYYKTSTQCVREHFVCLH